MMENLQRKLLEIENNLKQTEANLHALQGAKQILEQLIAEENAKAEQTENEIKE